MLISAHIRPTRKPSKRVFVGFCAAVGLLHLLQIARAQTNDAIAHWRFDEGSGTTAFDTSTNNYAAAISLQCVRRDKQSFWSGEAKAPCSRLLNCPAPGKTFQRRPINIQTRRIQQSGFFASLTADYSFQEGCGGPTSRALLRYFSPFPWWWDLLWRYRSKPDCPRHRWCMYGWQPILWSCHGQPHSRRCRSCYRGV